MLKWRAFYIVLHKRVEKYVIIGKEKIVILFLKIINIKRLSDGEGSLQINLQGFFFNYLVA